MVALILFIARFSGSIMEREYGQKKHSCTSIFQASLYISGCFLSQDIVSMFLETEISISSISTQAKGATTTIESSNSRMSSATCPRSSSTISSSVTSTSIVSLFHSQSFFEALKSQNIPIRLMVKKLKA
jgi:hypothetical protein